MYKMQGVARLALPFSCHVLALFPDYLIVRTIPVRSRENMENYTLVEKSRCGDRDAFAQIVKRYQGMVSAVTLNVVGNYAQSEDLAQETFLTAWKKLPELREPEKLASWLYGIARRVALRWTEKHQRNPLRQAVELDAETMTDYKAQIAAADRQQRKQSLELVWATVKELPETLREPLLLYYRFSKSVADIADSLELTDEAVRQRLSRGRKMLKAEVEKHIESVLESTGPSEHFTVAVLAALPIALTGEQVLAAGAAGATAAQSASSGGAGAGASFVAGVTAFFHALLYSWPTIFIGIGIALGIWSSVRNAPTLRARQWMLKVTFGYVIIGCLFVLSISSLAIIMSMLNSRFHYIFDYFLRVGIASIPVFVVVASYWVNQKWRQIVEEDSAKQNSSDQVIVPPKFLRSIYPWFVAALFSPVLVAAVGYFIQNSSRFSGSFSPNISFFFTGFGMLFILLFGLLLFTYPVLISKDQASFTKYPPRLPNLLAILTGEEKTPKGFRNRINFWGDFLGIGWGLFLLHVILLSLYKIIGTSGDFQFLVSWLPILFVYFLFAVFFAGIPRRRYWGMIFLGASTLLYYSGILSAHVMIGEPSFKDHVRDLMLVSVYYGLSAWYLLCFALLGAAGLWVFRRKG